MNFNFKYGGSSKAGNQTHKRFKIDNFLGVDYASSKLNAANFRATEMKNFIHRDGVNHKRFGWNEIAKIKDSEGNLLSINGFWEFKDRNMESAVYIVHAGTKLFRIDNFGNNSFETEYTDISNGFEFLDKRSYGIARGDFLYLFSGNEYLMYGKWNNEQYELRAVENGEKTYIPTTTIGISAEGSSIDVKRTHEEINLLHKRRRNKLIGEKELGANIILYESAIQNEAISDLIGFRIEIYDSNYNILQTYNYANPLENLWNKNILQDWVTASQTEYDSALQADKLDLGEFPLEKFFFDKLTTDYPAVSQSITKVAKGYNTSFGQVWYAKIETTAYRNDLVNYVSDGVISHRFNTDNELYFYINLTMKNDGSDTYKYSVYLIKDLVYKLDSKEILNPKIWIDGAEKTNLSYTDYFGNNVTYLSAFDLSNGTLILKNNFPPSIEGESNIIVEFEKEVEGNADKINKCQFGIMFGYSDTENLFVSGNPDVPNYDFHSSYPDDTETQSGIPVEEDLTYFGDLGYSVVGSIQSKIMGYTILEDGTLAIHKEANKIDPTIYLRNAVLDDAVDLEGNIIVDRNGNPYKKVYYPIFAGSMGEGMLNRFGSANLAGDKLFLSRNGVFGIVMNPNIKSNERFARERSRLVNPVLTKEDLESASSIVYDNRYYLSVNGRCYIADSRFRNQANVEMDDTFSYEWWVWDNVNARIWFILNNNLAFGTDNGQVCVFDKENNFNDQTYETVPTGGIMFNSVDNKFFVNQAYDNLILELNDNEGFVLKLEEDAEFELAEIILTKEDITSVSAGRINVSFEKFFSKIQFLDEKIIYIDNLVSGSPLEVNTPYMIKNIDYETYSFELWDSLGENKINIVGNEFTISRFIKDLPQTITNMNVEEGSFQLLDYDQENVKDVYVYGGSVLDDLSGYFSFKDNVVSEWWTPIFDLGTSEYSKNLHSIAFTPETVIGGKTDFGFKTRKNEKQFAMEGVTSLDFSNLDFTNFSFEATSFAKSFTKKLNVRNINFIMFYFRSTNDKDCVVNNLSITYSIGRLNKGVK